MMARGRSVLTDCSLDTVRCQSDGISSPRSGRRCGSSAVDWICQCFRTEVANAIHCVGDEDGGSAQNLGASQVGIVRETVAIQHQTSFILTFMKERFEKSNGDLECCLPFQIRPNFGANCLSILIRLPHEMMVSSTDAFPVPNGFGTGRIGGIE